MNESFENITVIKHPLVQDKLTTLRDKHTNNKNFKELVNEITLLLVYEATKNLVLTDKTVETPLETIQSKTLQGKQPVILPILRAGIGMVDGFSSLMPAALIGHIGLFRDEETLQPQRYYFKIPADSAERQFFICDPMLATGGTAVAAIDALKEKGVTQICLVCIVSSPEGVKVLHEHHPDVQIYTASLDRQLNENGYILPGLGDAGDRLFGTL